VCHDRSSGAVEVRIGVAINALLFLVLRFRLHHQFHGPPIDYAGLAAAAAASWVGVPGPGEPVLIAAGVFAAQHKLDIGSVLLIAWAAAAGGGIVGWLIGMKAGRVVLSAPGPLRGLRLKALARGEEVFTRVPVLAVLLTPSWIAGIHRVRARLYVPVNTVSAAVWAAGIGLGAYFAGPTVIDVVQDIGWVTGGGLVILVLVAVWLEIRRRRRRGRERGSEATASD
jgi:membrane protein DedA with SNARE-associated domain